MTLSAQLMRGILDSIATRLDEARDISRYMTGLLVFLGLLGTFWGLIETVSAVGSVIQDLKPTDDAASMFDSLRSGLAAPLSGMGISFSSSLFGLAGSLVLGFLDLQSSQAQNRFYTELEDWLSTTVNDDSAEPAVTGSMAGEVNTALDRLRRAVDQAGSGKAAASRDGRSRGIDPASGASHARASSKRSANGSTARPSSRTRSRSSSKPCWTTRQIRRGRDGSRPRAPPRMTA